MSVYPSTDYRHSPFRKLEELYTKTEGERQRLAMSAGQLESRCHGLEAELRTIRSDLEREKSRSEMLQNAHDRVIEQHGQATQEGNVCSTRTRDS